MIADRKVVRLVRHGRAEAGWDSASDPDLDDVGQAQASTVAGRLATLGPSIVVTSPLLRCRSTAQAYADLVESPVAVVADVAEIPSPEGVDMADRVAWLRGSMLGTWAELGPHYTSYRDRVVDFVRGCDDATVIFSHFVAINAVIGACLGDDRMVIRRLDNCSVTTVMVADNGLTLAEGGHEANTLIR